MTRRDSHQPRNTAELRNALMREHGPILGGAALWRLLGYRTPDAFRKATQRGTLPVRTFEIANRRGRFAMTTDVIDWVESMAATAHSTRPSEEDNAT